MAEGDCVERQQPQKNIGFHTASDRDLDDASNDSKSTAEEQCWRGKAQPYYGARCSPYAAQDATDGW